MRYMIGELQNVRKYVLDE